MFGSPQLHQMSAALDKWEASGRWDSIWLAGVRDTEPSTLFDMIIAGDIPATIVKEDDHILAFKDINPAAPGHVLVIPKDRAGLTRLSKSTPEHYEILGRLMVAAGEIAKDEELGFGDGARIVINDGKDAGQEVFHLHGEFIVNWFAFIFECCVVLFRRFDLRIKLLLVPQNISNAGLFLKSNRTHDSSRSGWPRIHVASGLKFAW